MSKGYLIVNVYLEDIGQPVEGANVEVIGENYNKNFITDNVGKTNKIELDAPDIKYSLTPQEDVKPYSTYDLKVTKLGLKALTIKNVEIFSSETSLQDVYMHEEDNTKGAAVIVLPEHHLWEQDDTKIPEDLIKKEAEPGNNSLRVLPSVIIPEYIIVHDGSPSSSATNYVVPFIDYIKNVASSEIYSTWPVEAIKANVHAIVSFTLNRIFTEWYRSKGYTFTITSSPAYDQKYTHNRTIFQSISDVVDNYFRYYIRLTGLIQPLLAQYVDGIKNTTKGMLSQWGSKELADKGYKAIDILKHYYTTNLSLEVAEEMLGLPLSFPGFNLALNSCGYEVQKVQVELNRIRGHYPAIPAISPANGKFEDSTKRAVEVFQKTFNLSVTGKVDFATWYKISNVFTGVAGLIKGVN